MPLSRIAVTAVFTPRADGGRCVLLNSDGQEYPLTTLAHRRRTACTHLAAVVYNLCGAVKRAGCDGTREEAKRIRPIREQEEGRRHGCTLT